MGAKLLLPRDPTRLYLGPVRVHHGAVGVALLLFGRPYWWRLLGAALVWHDRADRPFQPWDPR